MSDYRYPWPASALTPDEMAILYQARERSPSRVPITQLIAEAVRTAYATGVTVPSSPTPRSTNDQFPKSQPEEPVPYDCAA
jgi:hypothetical protein